VVVTVGVTVVEPFAEVELNVPGEMEIVVAPLVVQLSVLLFPEGMLVGLAVKELTVGADPEVGFGLSVLVPLVMPLPHPLRPMYASASTRQSATQKAHAWCPQDSAALPGEFGAFTRDPPSCFSHKCKERSDHVTTGQKGRSQQ
jgi:hypothetical protein